jgi:hypothetical protein
MPLHQLLVEMLHRKVPIALSIKPQHPGDLLARRTPARSLAEPTIHQPGLSLITQSVTPAPKRTLAHPEHLGCFNLA